MPHPSKVTAADVTAIRARVAAGELQRAIAADHGIDQSTVSDLAAGLNRAAGLPPVHRPAYVRVQVRPSLAGLPVPPPGDPAAFLANVTPPDPATGCQQWTGPKDSRGQGSWYEAGRRIAAPRVALALRLGHPTAGGQPTSRTCPTRGCVNPEHLALGAQPYRHRGSAHAATTLTEADVLAARAEYAAAAPGEASIPVLAARYGVLRTTMHAVLTGTTWKHLPGAVPTGTHRKGAPVGAANHLARLSEEQVHAIRAAYDAGRAPASIGAEHHMRADTIRKIGRRLRWAFLPERVSGTGRE